AEGSLAPNTKVRFWPRTPATGPPALAWGTAFRTVRRMVSVSESAGVPLSVTRTVIRKDPGPSAGFQVKGPVLGLRAARAGAPGARLKVSRSPASGSVAVAVKRSRLPSKIDRLPMAPSTGGRLVESTVTVIVSAALRAGEPLSVTCTVRVKVPGV